ncbi:hypothetical protein ABTX81_28045 [Kitasatospora sp. NPDC097605]|uniref:hypothetical protein n=1 Tax=Kitasatospora sp. NPDC097605 TaxID=3157226 RepID=UPI00331BDC3C
MTSERAWTLTAERLPDGQVIVTIAVHGSRSRAHGSFRLDGRPSVLIGRGKREPVVVAFAGGPLERWRVTDRSGRTHPVERVDAAGLSLGVAVLPARTRGVAVHRLDATGAPDVELREPPRSWWRRRGALPWPTGRRR